MPSRSGRQFARDGVAQDRIVHRRVGRKASHHLTLLADQKLLEIPQHVAGVFLRDAVAGQLGAEIAARLFLRPRLLLHEALVQRMLARPLDDDLFKHGKLHAKGAAAKVRDLGIAARFLRAEFIGGKAGHYQALGLPVGVEFFQPCVLGRQAAGRCHVDHQHHLAAIRVQAAGVAIDAAQGNVVDTVAHDGSPGKKGPS